MRENHQRSKHTDIIYANELGIKYNTGSRRDDFRSLSFKLILNRKKDRKSFWALKGINFKGYHGEVLGIIGSNGAGKTTLCKVISGILNPDSGMIDVKGEVSALLSMGAGFDNELTGKDNVFLNGMMLGMSKKEVKGFFDRIHEFSGLGDFIFQPVKYYSSGMKGRLGFSIAAMLEPEILVLDETLSAGDLEFSQRAAQKIEEIVDKSKMVIVVTHSIEFVEKHCTRAIWIDSGSIKSVGDPVKVADLYKKNIPQSARSKKRRINLKKTAAKIRDTTVASVNNLGISFRIDKKAFWALKDISFSVYEGEIVGIIGHNGAGKSTLCRAMCGIYLPDEGEIKIDGETTALLGFGTGFNIQLSGRDNILLNGMMMGISKKRLLAIQQGIVEFAELEAHIEKPIKYFSSGMRARLGFSIAAAIRPELFIIDEALNAGDLAFQEKASAKIQELITQAKAVIVVTHSLSFVEKVCTRAIWIHQGRMKFDGDPEEALGLYKEYVGKHKEATSK